MDDPSPVRRSLLPTEELNEHEMTGTPLGIQLLTSNPLAQLHLGPYLLEYMGFYEKLEYRI